MKDRKHLESKSLSILLFAFIFMLYAVVYMTKSMFSSAMATIVEEGFMTKSQTGFINAMFWLVYAVFQIIGGFAVDKFSPHKLIMIGIGGAVIANAIIYCNQSYPVIIAAWTFNAIIQFGLWPGVFKIVSTQTAPAVSGIAVFWLLFSTSVGLGLSMLVASFVSDWRQNFLISVISLLAFLLMYIVFYRFIDKKMISDEVSEISKETKLDKEKQPVLPLMMSSGLIAFMVVCLLRTAIDNGIKMMTPVMLMESYEALPAAISTRISSILVLFSAAGILISGLVRSKITGNEAKAQIFLYGICIIPLAVVCFVGSVHYLVVLIALSLSVMVIHSASPFSQSFLALRFDKYGRIGTVSGILNATASIGNVIASYGFAKMAEMVPWSTVSISWTAAALICAGICAVMMPRWTRFIK